MCVCYIWGLVFTSCGSSFGFVQFASVCTLICFLINIVIYCFYLGFLWLPYLFIYLSLFIKLGLYDGVLVEFFFLILLVLFYCWFICALFFWFFFIVCKGFGILGYDLFCWGWIICCLLGFLAYMVFVFWIVYMSVCLLFESFCIKGLLNLGAWFYFWLFQSFALPFEKHYQGIWYEIYNLIHSGIFMYSWNHHHNQNRQHYRLSPKDSSCPAWSLIPSLLPATTCPGNHWAAFSH